MAFPWKIAAVGGVALLALVALSGDSSAAEPAPPPSPKPLPKPQPNGKVAPVAVPPSNGPAYVFTALAAGNVYTAPTTNSDVVTPFPAGSAIVVPNPDDQQPAGSGGWVATGDLAGGMPFVGGPYGWVQISKLDTDNSHQV